MEWLLVSDVDDTLTGDDAALAALATSFERARGSLAVAYNSSRPCASIRSTIDSLSNLPTPDYVIGALGTEIEEGKSGARLDEYARMLAFNWQREPIDAVARSLGFRPHPAEFQTPLKASYDIPGEADYREYLARIRAEGLHAKVIFSNRIKLDVVPENAGKGSAIRFLIERLGLSADRVVVAGDSGNDIDMFAEPFHGIIVGNADDDLQALEGRNIYHAESSHAGGVEEGLRYWGALPPEGVD